MKPKHYTLYGSGTQMMTIPRFLLLHSGTGWDEKGPRDIGYATSPQARAEGGYALHYKLPMLEDNETGEVVSQLPAIVLSLLVGGIQSPGR